jgi:hypothetical protein
MTEKKLKVGNDEVELYNLTSALPKILIAPNKMREQLKSIMRTDKINADYKIAYKDFVSFILDGFPINMSLSYAAGAKNYKEQFHSVRKLYEQIKSLDQEYIKYLRVVEDVYVFDRDIEKYLNDLTSLYVTGNTAVNLYNATRTMLDHFLFINALSNGRTMNWPAELQKACGLIYHASNLTLQVNHVQVQLVANQLDNSTRLTEDEKETLKELNHEQQEV